MPFDVPTVTPSCLLSSQSLPTGSVRLLTTGAAGLSSTEANLLLSGSKPGIMTNRRFRGFAGRVEVYERVLTCAREVVRREQR